MKADPDQRSQVALRQIAKQAMETKTGARGLRGILETLLMKTQFDLPRLSADGVSRVLITEDMVATAGEPMLVYKQAADAIG